MWKTRLRMLLEKLRNRGRGVGPAHDDAMKSVRASRWRTVEWGPFLSLSARLASRAMPYFGSGVPWRVVADHYGGLWGLYARNLPSYEKPLGRGPWARLYPWEDHPGVLMECHRWLGARNLRYLARYYVAAPAQTPVALSLTSQKGLEWTLAAMAADTNHPTARALAAAKQYPLTAPVTPGDLLALHIHIETLAEKRCPDGKPPEGCVLGGLRKPSFLTAFSQGIQAPDESEGGSMGAGGCLLAILPAPRRYAPNASHALKELARQSPLTCLIYSDLLGQQPDPEAIKSLLNLESVQGDWVEIWVSLLASSLLGALLSSLPTERALARERAYLARLEEEDKRRQQRSKSIYVPDPRIPQARAKCQRLRQRMGQDYRQKLSILSAILSADGGGVAHLRLRLLDMLARHIVAEQTRQNARSSSPVDVSMPRGRTELLGPGGLCFRRFARMLFGPDWETLLPPPEIAETQNSKWAASARDQLRAAFNQPIPVPSDADAPSETVQRNDDQINRIAREAGIHPDVVRQIVARYADDNAGGVALPGGEKGFSPERLLRAWLMALQERIPQPPPKIQTREESQAEVE